MPEPSPPLTLSELARAVGHRWRLLVAASVAGIVVGIALHVALPQTYSATASVQVEATGVDPLAQPEPRTVDMATEATVAASRGIAGSRTVHVSAAGESSVLLITHTGDTPASAAAGANAVARAYLTERSRRATRALATLRGTLTRQLRALPASAPASQVQPLAADLARARRLQVGGGAIIDAARPPDHADLPGLVLMCLAGGLLGLLLAVPPAALRTRPARPASRVVMLDVDPSSAPALRHGAAALADHVLVLRESPAHLGLAEQWCRHLRSVGIPASVIHAAPDDS